MGLFMGFFVTFFWLVLRNIRAAIAANLEPVLGPCGWWERQVRMFRTLWVFSWCLSERYERLATDRPLRVDGDGEEGWRNLLESGKGLILVTAHMGNWEAGSMLPASRDRRRVHVVREAETDPRAQRFIENLIRRGGGDLYTTHFADDPQLGMILLDVLRDGDIVALQGDRPRSGGRAAEVTLFGRPFPLPIGPAVLARATGAPIVPVFVFREGRLRYRSFIRPAIEVRSTADRQADVEEAMRRFTAELEWAIRREPHQWFCFRKVWEPDQGSTSG
jgi:KDO2-lipid IV(A) lauroyltransferase